MFAGRWLGGSFVPPPSVGLETGNRRCARLGLVAPPSVVDEPRLHHELDDDAAIVCMTATTAARVVVIVVIVMIELGRGG